MADLSRILAEFGNLTWPSFVVALILSFGLHRILARVDRSVTVRSEQSTLSILSTFVLSASLSMAVIVGITRLRNELAWPERYWHCLPYVGIGVSAIASPFAITSMRCRLPTRTIISCIAAWFLVPDWNSLALGRPVYIPMLGVYFTILGSLYHLTARFTSPRESLFAMFATMVTLAAAIAGIVSLQFGQVAAIVAAGLAGCFITSLLVKLESRSLVGMMPCGAVLVGGAAFVGFIYPQTPVYEFLLVPLAPASLLGVELFTRQDKDASKAFRMALYFLTLGIIAAVIGVRYGGQ